MELERTASVQDIARTNYSDSESLGARIGGLRKKLITLEFMKDDTTKEFVDAEIDRLASKLAKLIQQGGFPQLLVGKKFEENVKTVCQWLEDDNVSIIGLWGMEGVGKTAIARHIYKELESCPDIFVSWVTVPRDFSIDELQDDIAEALHIDIPIEFDERKKGTELCKQFEGYMKAFKKCVLILDDVSSPLPLDELGIPIELCKIILTAQSLEVCQVMDCQMKIQLEPLCFEESWELFMEKLRRGTVLPPQLESIARLIVKECDGLPLGIITMARSLSVEDDLCEWNTALEKVKEIGVDQGGMNSKLLRIVRYCYDQLKDLEVQRCFLYCGLYPANFIISRDSLIYNFIDENVIDGRSEQAKSKKSHEILNKLEDACLLEGGTKASGKSYVKMNNSLWIMANQIAKWHRI